MELGLERLPVTDALPPRNLAVSSMRSVCDGLRLRVLLQLFVMQSFYDECPPLASTH